MNVVNITEKFLKCNKITGGYIMENTIFDLRRILDELDAKYGNQAIITIDIDEVGEYPEVDCTLRYSEIYDQ